MSGQLLISVLSEPQQMATLSIAQWNSLLSLARRCRVLARLAVDAQNLSILKDFPKAAQGQMQSALIEQSNIERALRWEIDRLSYALRETKLPMILLKGTAYLSEALPNARGRGSSDVDLLYQREDLPVVEAALVKAGWRQTKLHPYDQAYYRQWMHELPPMTHPHRQLDVDLHHNILPLTGRLHPDASKLHEALVPLPDGNYRLSDVDLCLHCAAHLFQDGEVAGALRDLLDCHELLTHFAQSYAARGEDFWQVLTQRAQEMDIVRPMIYAIVCANEIFKTDVPERAMQWCLLYGTDAEIMRAMRWLVRYALMPSHPLEPSMKKDIARWILYCRSHWLKMPPVMLIKHLSHKAWRGVHPVKEEE